MSVFTNRLQELGKKHVRTLCAAGHFHMLSKCFSATFFKGKSYIQMKFSFGIRIKIVEMPSIQPSPITESIPSESNKTTVHSLPVES